VTISKSLNGAFIAHQTAGVELSHHSKETV
jgi:hypothetical protein